MKAKFDLHSHTKGSDGNSTPIEIATAAKKAGLDGLCLTDHHTNMTDEVHAVADALRLVGVLPIIGVEYSTADGHLLIYGIDVPKMAWGMYPSMQVVVDEVNALGGAAVVPHPYKGYQRALHDRIYTINGLAAIESLNGQVEVGSQHLNRKAREAAKTMGIPRTGASDAHWADRIGITYTEFDGAIPDEATFLDALRSGKFLPRRDEVAFAAAAARKTKYDGDWFKASPGAPYKAPVRAAARRTDKPVTEPHLSLAQVLRRLGWTYVAAQNGYTAVYNNDGQFEGMFTSKEIWKMLQDKGLYLKPQKPTVTPPKEMKHE